MLLFVFAIRIAGTEVRAAGAWKGYAVYRDGVDIVVPNVNDHAGIMDENTIRYAYPVTHAKGPGGTVRWASWEDFLDEKNILVFTNQRDVPSRVLAQIRLAQRPVNSMESLMIFLIKSLTLLAAAHMYCRSTSRS